MNHIHSKILGFFLGLMLLGASAQAMTSFSRGGFDITVEPVLGYQFTHSGASSGTGMLIYGARVTAGSQLLSAEAEYTHGSNTTVTSNPEQTVKTDQDAAKLGLLSSPALTSWLNFLARAGGQASRQKVETIQSGVSSTDNGKWNIDPYAGVGLQGALGSQISLNAEVTYVVDDWSHWNKNDIQTTFSVKMNVNTF